MSNSLWPHGLQHARLPCPSSTPGACSDSCLSRGWCHPTISSSAAPFSFAFNLSQHQGLFQWVGSWHQGPKYWGFSFSISPSSEYSALITFRIDWFDLLGSVKCLHLTNCFLSLDETCKALFTTITNPCNYKNYIFKRRKLNVRHSNILSKCLVPCLACTRT